MRQRQILPITTGHANSSVSRATRKIDIRHLSFCASFTAARPQPFCKRALNIHKRLLKMSREFRLLAGCILLNITDSLFRFYALKIPELAQACRNIAHVRKDKLDNAKNAASKFRLRFFVQCLSPPEITLRTEFVYNG